MLRLFSVLALLCLPLSAAAHEFWIDARQWQVAPGAPLQADLRVGQDFEGPSFAYLPHRTRRFDIVTGGTIAPVEGRAGDRPGLDTVAPAEGLAVVVHVTGDHLLTYTDWAIFESFLTHKAWTPVLAEHRARGLPETGFRERYSRHAKALVAVGDGRGSDGEVGLETEIVALANPYVDDLTEGLPVRVLYQGKPRPGAQVEVFAKGPDGTVSVQVYEADAEGGATIAVTPGVTYLVDSVVLRPLEPEGERDPVWESLWASLTFRVP
ncbi:MAG: DUF4198 domain-containing protein [Rhodobacteraceae bacterium]|nr:MAG: DUF4198 domain-containing protein [Paracoccaceae bacterium]